MIRTDKTHDGSHQHDKATTPLLLKLPPELRTQIFRLLVGDRLIHLLYTEQQRPSPDGFRHCVCTASMTEDDAYHDFLDGKGPFSPENDPYCHVPTFKQRHARCKHWHRDMDRWFSETERIQWWRIPHEDRPRNWLDLSILGVCRQIHTEASSLLWTTTKFSFEDPLTLKMFMSGLSTVQRDQLTTIHIDFEWEEDVAKAWAALIDKRPLRNLAGLRTLHATFEQNFSQPSGLYSPTRISVIVQASLLKLRDLPWKHVSVIISDDVGLNMRQALNGYRWTMEKKRTLAGNLRKALLEQ